MGDLNCDFLRLNSNRHAGHLFSLTKDFNMTQLISKPTRVTSSSSTLIDLIFTSNTEKVTYNDVVEIGVSDHYMIVASWGNVKQKCDSHKYLITRNTNKLDVQEFQAELASVNWDEVL